jgi:hypothetical protein
MLSTCESHLSHCILPVSCYSLGSPGTTQTHLSGYRSQSTAPLTARSTEAEGELRASWLCAAHDGMTNTTPPPQAGKGTETRHTVPSQTLFGGCGPSVMLGTWALPKPRLGTTGSQLLLGSGPSQRTEVEEQACPSEVGPTGPQLFRVRDARGWLGWEAVDGRLAWEAIPTNLGLLCQVESGVGNTRGWAASVPHSRGKLPVL